MLQNEFFLVTISLDFGPLALHTPRDLNFTGAPSDPIPSLSTISGWFMSNKQTCGATYVLKTGSFFQTKYRTFISTSRPSF